MCKWQRCIFAKVEVCGPAGGPWSPSGPTPVLSWLHLWPRGGQNQSQTGLMNTTRITTSLVRSWLLFSGSWKKTVRLYLIFETYLFTFGSLCCCSELFSRCRRVRLLSSCGAWWWHVGSSRTRERTCVSCMGGQILCCWAIEEAVILYFRWETAITILEKFPIRHNKW